MWLAQPQGQERRPQRPRMVYLLLPGIFFSPVSANPRRRKPTRCVLPDPPLHLNSLDQWGFFTDGLKVRACFVRGIGQLPPRSKRLLALGSKWRCTGISNDTFLTHVLRRGEQTVRKTSKSIYRTKDTPPPNSGCARIAAGIWIVTLT